MPDDATPSGVPPRPAGEPRHERFVDDYLAYLLAAASEAVSARFHAVVRSAGLRAPEWRVLACLADADGLTVSELSALTLLEQSRLTKTINAMERAGLLRRAPDPDDGRRVRVRIAPLGRTAVAPLLEAARADERLLLAGLGAEEVRALKAALRRLTAPR